MSRLFISQFRIFSTKSAKVPLNKADLIKTYNHESKSLFGAVHKKKKTVSELPTPAVNSVESETSSEMYWLLDHQLAKDNENTDTKAKRPLKSRKKKDVPMSSSLDENLNDRNLQSTASRLEDSSIENPPTAPLANIPFSSKGLKCIATFPLVASQVQEHPETTGNYESHYPSVGKILQATLSDSARKSLINWKMNKIKELGEDAFKTMQEAQLNEGKMFHKSLEDYLCAGVVPDEDSKLFSLWQSIAPALEELDPQIQFAEKMIEHPFLKYRGVVDCVCTVNSETTVIEWKKSEKLKANIAATHDAPLQLCAYLGALTADPQYRLNATKGYVIVAHTEGQPAQVHQMDEISLQRYWQLWLRRLQEFWIRTRDGTLPEPI